MTSVRLITRGLPIGTALGESIDATRLHIEHTKARTYGIVSVQSVEVLTIIKFGRYKLMLLGIILIAVGAVVPMEEFTVVLLVAGWGLVVFATVRGRR